jgi:HAD superfamily phosphatase (TIGR01668 family)
MGCALQFRPDHKFTRAGEITPEVLERLNVRGLILDLDNTLTRWEDDKVAPGIHDWIGALKEAGIRMVILSNGLREKQDTVSRALDLPLVRAPLPKPFAVGFAKALKVIGLPREEVAMVGDIVVTDIWGANRLGIRTMLVEPLSPRDFPGTKVWRALEVLFRLRRPCGRNPAQ